MKNDIRKNIKTSRGTFHVRDTQEGYPLVCIHGWPQSSHCWQPLVPLLSEQFRMIRPDTRGMGDSERTLPLDAYLKKELAQDIISVLDEMDIQEFMLVGHDWGGVIAQEVALAYPERVKGLAILNIIVINNARGNAEVREALKEKGYTYNWYQTFQQQPELADVMIKGNEEVWVSHFLKMAKQKTFPSEDLQEYVRTFKIPLTPTTSANYYRALYQDMKRWATLGNQKFKMPGLYIHGKRDIVIIPEYTHHIEDCFEGDVKLISLDAGHFVQEEMPSEVAEALGGFFGKLI
jgi:pimeloyl-ACP methyl ester carboxylesterase